MTRGYSKTPEVTRTKRSNSLKGKNTWAKGSKKSKKDIEKIRERTKGEKNPFYGKKHSKETIEKIRLSSIGRKHTQKWKNEISLLNMGNKRALGYKFTPKEIENRVKKFKETFDKIGRKTEANRLFRSQLQYKLWRTAVFVRDNFKCIWCGSKKQIESDHIKPFAYYPELRLSVDNGRTLCHLCHTTTDSYANKAKQNYGKPR